MSSFSGAFNDELVKLYSNGQISLREVISKSKEHGYDYALYLVLELVREYDLVDLHEDIKKLREHEHEYRS